MFHSFFPNPRVFFLSAVIWTIISISIWFLGVGEIGIALDYFKSLAPAPVEGERPPFITGERLWTYLFIVVASIVFASFWTFISKSRWNFWAVWGSTILILWTYFEVQISLYMNDWYGEFFNLIQNALESPNTVSLDTYLNSILTVLVILTFRIFSLVLLAFFTSHYVFRWRTAMNDYYMRHWQLVRSIEGAAQRVQEDTQKFARIIEGLGTRFVQSIMTLIAFLPLLWVLSDNIKELPWIGAVDHSLVYIALLSAIFGTVLLALVGIKLPGLEFNNQKVEAAYRKELVYGEDRKDHARPNSVIELYGAVRRNYFRLYFHYMYFDVARFIYLQGSIFIPLLAMGPSIVTGAITFGIFRQIQNAFDEVEDSFRFLVNSWKTIIELISIYKRLIAFETVIPFDPTPDAPLSEETEVLAE